MKPRKMWACNAWLRDETVRLFDNPARRWKHSMSPVLVIPLDAESVEELREKLRLELCVAYPIHCDLIADRVLAAIGITPRPRAKRRAL